MALPPQAAQLVEKLNAAGAQSKVAWEDTAEENTFLASVAKFVVTVSKTASGYYPAYSLTIADQSGKTVDEGHVKRPEDGYEAVAELWENARRSARNAKVAYDEMLAFLK